MITFKKPIDNMVSEAKGAAYSAMYGQYGYNTITINGYEFVDKATVQKLIESAVAASIESVIRNIYTNNDFEEDIGLK